MLSRTGNPFHLSSPNVWDDTRLASKKVKNAGSGLLCVVAQDKSLLMWLEIKVWKLVANYGRWSRISIKPVVVKVIFGEPMKKFSQKKLIEVLAKNQERQIRWNDGITSCDNPTLAISARLYLSQKTISTMCWLLAFILSDITCHLRRLLLLDFGINVQTFQLVNWFHIRRIL